MIFLFFVAILPLLLIFFAREKFRLYLSRRKKIFKLPSPPSNYFGNIHPLFDTPEKIFQLIRKWGREYYPIYNIWAGFMMSANIVNPYDFEIILSNMEQNMKGYMYEMLHNWLGTGLLTSEGSKWQKRRKILTPAFHFNILQEFIKVFNEETKVLVTKLKEECHRDYISINDYISDFTLNSIGETAMGTNFDLETTTGREYKKAIQKIGQIFVYRITHPWLIPKFLYIFAPKYFFKEQKLVKILHNFTNNVIAKRQKNFKPVVTETLTETYSKRKRLAMLDLLLTAKNEDGSIDDEGIREEVDTFMFEGHDTTAVAITYALMLIACHRDVQEKIFNEIQDVLQGTTTPDYKTLQDLKYMERCIKEVLRLYPSVPFIARVLGEDIVTHSGHKIEAGSVIQMHIYDVHHNPEFYPDPEKFDPDRFLPENCQNRHTFAYVPFSAGSRNCIGQKFALLEMKAVLCGILSEFILEAVDTPETIVLVADVVLRTKESIKVKFVPREKTLNNNNN